MAPQLALDALQGVRVGGTVLDPMCGSGTVLRAAAELGLCAVGTDIDPLAVLMSRVATTPIAAERVRASAKHVAVQARNKLNAGGAIAIPVIDSSPAATAFIDYWYAPEQQTQLRALASVIPPRSSPTSRLLRLALSRTIITKDRGASLARDVSHSRPHRVRTSNDFDVIAGFLRAVDAILGAISTPHGAEVAVRVGDARRLNHVDDESVAAIVTSPPYLNAIDYIRGHRLALVWLGTTLAETTAIRSRSIGAERSPDGEYDREVIDRVLPAAEAPGLAPRLLGMFQRYVGDMHDVMAEAARVLEPGGRAVFVVGNSTIRGTFVDNAAVATRAAILHGLQLIRRDERELPSQSRYLPPPSTGESSLSLRMRTEVVLTFRKS